MTTPEEHLSDVMYHARLTATRCYEAIREDYPLARDVDRIIAEKPEGWEEAVAALNALARACAYFRDTEGIVREAASHAINSATKAKTDISVPTM